MMRDLRRPRSRSRVPSATLFVIASPPTTTFANEGLATTEIALAVFSSTTFAIKGTAPGLAWKQRSKEMVR